MHFRSAMFSVLFSLLISLYPTVSSSQNTCHAADDKSVRIIALINNLMDPSLSGGRATIGMPTVGPANVTLNTDPTICARAGQAVDSVVRVWNPNAHITTPATSPLYVFHVGTAYAVADYDSYNPTNLSRWLLVFGSMWQFITAFRL
jgi:hypothetical protein